eukprot:296392-Rhodomonas_salina.2
MPPYAGPEGGRLLSTLCRSSARVFVFYLFYLFRLRSLAWGSPHSVRAGGAVVVRNKDTVSLGSRVQGRGSRLKALESEV